MRRVVVLPAPFGPSSASTSPAPTESDTSCTAARVPKTRVSPEVSTHRGAHRFNPSKVRL